MKTSAFIAISLDGFIARENGDIDWLPAEQAAPDDGDFGYNAFSEAVDALVMGRGTYDKMVTFGFWPFGDRPVVVLSTRELDRPAHVPASVERMACPPAQCIARLEARGVRQLYVDGGYTIQSFLRAGLLNRLIITRVPVLIGNGIRLFGPLQQDVKLRHVSTRTFSNGLVQSEYAILR